ncbi:zinc finger protein 518A isoform X2 [Myotis daubentonii]|uniref:zinc finger protein 518A isoform X2 n=1 Tax=Myotis daubentonii TaxID=98922 RepID=UPI002872BAFA|nr:zinc finger protein 518A isoform X2 [Myotis daubentonii]
MPSEQKQLFFDENEAALKTDYNVKNDIVDTIRSIIKPKILESSFHYKLKNVKIDLPKINIPNEVLLKHEVDKYRKLFQHKPQTARKSINMKTGSCVEESVLLHKSEKVEETGIKMSAKVLSFNCLKCQDSTRYSPNDLQKHFQMWHQGELPSYPCEMCSFSANDFQVFKLHRRIHRGTLVKCDICNDEKIYTLLDLTKHFISTHCVNGSFQCEKCTFSTLDVGTFVQHIHRHNDVHYKSDKYHHIYFTRGEIQKHLHVNSVTFPFNCKYCRFGTSKREYLVRHVLTLHKEHLYAKEKLEKDKYEKRMAQTSVGLKLILKRYKIGTSRKIFWKRKKINGSDESIEQNTEVLKNVNNTQAKSEDQSHLTQEHLNEEKDERLHCENNDKTAESELEKPTLLSTGQYNRAGELSNSTSGSSKTAVQGPTMVTVKNNRITVPANYSAKFMGFKMVDGKQHIVIKLLPTIKQNLCSPGSQSDTAKDSTANLQLQSLDTTGFITRVKTESEQASEFLPPEINQLLQDVLKTKSDVKQDSSNTPDKGLSLHCDQSFQKHEGEGKIIESSKDFKVQGIFPIPSCSMGINVPPNYLNLKCQEAQMLSVSQDVRDSEKTPRISGIGTLLKTQSDAIITQQLVKDKLRATTQNLGSLYMQSPLVNSEPKKALFVQTTKGFFVPLHIANKPGLHVVSGRPQVNTQGVPATLLLNKKPGMILTFNNGKFEGVNTVKSESAQACGTTTKEPCRTPFLKVEPNNNCLTPTLCSSIGSCLSTKSSSENTLPLKGPYIIKTPASSSGKPVPPPNIIITEHPSTKSNILDPAKQQNEVFPKPPLFTLLPDGKQAVFLKCVMPNKTELLKPKLVQNSTSYQNIQPKIPEGTPQKILLKIFNPVLNVTAANNLSVSNSVFSSQKDNVSSNQTAGGEQKEPDSSRDALPFLIDDTMPANEIVVTSTATSESSEEPVHASDHSEARVLRCKTNCAIGRSFNKQKTSPQNFSRIKTHVRSKDSETVSVSRNRNCKRKCKDSYQEPPRKTSLHRKCKEKIKPEDVHESFGFSRPRLSKDSVRTLRLFPFSSKQLVKCPRRNQPVVVLNHPDADAPEVVNVMKTISKFNGHVLKVSLSERTISALLKPVCCKPSKTTCDFSKRHKTFKPISSVKERFVLKLTLKKTSKNNYRIVKTTSENVLKAKFNCWYCGRVFDNQDAWAGHGQRHLMEATRDWNMLE